MSYNTVAIIKNGVKQKLPAVMVAPKVDGPDYVEVVADGVKTLATLLNELYVLINTTKLSSASYVEIKSINGNSTIYNYQYMDTSQNIYCSMSLVTASGGEMNTVTIKSTGSTRKSAVGTTVTDESSSIFDSGTKIRMYYNRYSLDLTTRASNSVYDNTNSDLSATDAQGAIDELAKPTFTEASTRANIASGDNFATILGKIKKFFTDLKTVAFTGSYNDLSDKPTIPAAQVNSDWNATSGAAKILNKPSLATVATSGSYNDLSNKPTSMAPTSGSNNYCKVVQNSNLNDFAKQYFAMGMHSKATANPTGSGKWVHAITMGWEAGVNTSWISQIALGTQDETGMWYRTTSGNIADKGWTRLIDSSNIGSQTVAAVKDYNNNTPVKFGYSTSAMAVSAVSWIAAWDASVSGEYRLRAIQPSQLSVSSAGSATRDGNGSVISSTYLKLTGGTLSGQLGLSSNGYTTKEASGYTADGYGNWTHKRSNANDYWHINAYGGGEKFAVYYDSGSFFSLGHGYFINGGYWSDIWSNANGTLCVKSASNWLNLQSANIQCRNGADSAWAPCLASAFNTQSSRRYKENIRDISEDDAEKLLNVRVVKYDYKSGVRSSDRERYNQYGVIAEEVVNVLPSVVEYAIPYGEEYHFKEPVPDGVDYSKFVPYLIKMVQMQQKEIDGLKALVKGE